MKSLLLFSGGIDSSALLYWQRPSHALLINYGQLTYPSELNSATEITRSSNVPLSIIEIDSTPLGMGTLIGDKPTKESLYSEWWPFRNQLLLTLASMYASKKGYSTVLIGLTNSDNLYKDTSPDFINHINSLTKMQEGNINVIAPAMYMNSLDLVRLSGIPNSVLAWTHSCNVSCTPCAVCYSCLKYRHIMSSLDI